VDLDAATAVLMGTLFTDAMTRDILAALYTHSPEQAIEHYVDLFARAIGLKEPTP